MDYIAATFTLTPTNSTVSDVLASILAESGYESFSETLQGMTAFIPAKLFNEDYLREFIPETLYGSAISYSWELIPGQDWNHEWEKNYFQPIVIGTDCVIHSSFHTDYPKATWDIVIDPKMAFGTGHHETTSLMLEFLLELDVKGKSFLDMGCGTAVLAILASMKGAGPLLGIDIDEWACENALENIRLNGTPGIEILVGDASTLSGKGTFDLVFANINRNILLSDMDAYVGVMLAGSSLFMSGFYTEDLAVIRAKAERLGLRYVDSRSRNNWCACRFAL